MKKLACMMAIVFSVASVSCFAADTKPDSTKEMCKAGKNCCKKMKTASAATKAKCAKACADKAAKG